MAAAADLNYHVLVESGRPVPESSFASFIEKGRAGSLPEDVARRLSPFANLRNRRVREYETLDDGLVHQAIQGAQRFFPLYAGRVRSVAAERP